MPGISISTLPASASMLPLQKLIQAAHVAPIARDGLSVERHVLIEKFWEEVG